VCGQIADAVAARPLAPPDAGEGKDRIWQFIPTPLRLVGNKLFDAWEEVAPQLGLNTRIYALAVHNNRLFGGTYPSKLYRAKMNVGTDMYALQNTIISIDGTNWNADGVSKTSGGFGDLAVGNGTFACTEDATGKKITCSVNGTLQVRGIDMSHWTGNGYVQSLTGDLSGDEGGTVDDASSLSFSSNVLTITMTAGQILRDCVITRNA